MSPEQVLFAALSGNTSITAVVEDRIYPVVLPDQKLVPAIVFQRTNTEYTNTIGNTAIAHKATFDVLCIAEQFGDAEALCDIVEAMEQFAKINRTNAWDQGVENYASVLSIEVWNE